MADAHAILRRETRDEHDRVDAAFSRFGLEGPGYARFLKALARAYLPVEDALAATAVARLVPGWREHRRGDALRADLGALGLTPAPPLAAPHLPTDAHALGAWYVLEGSRLGGALLARQVAPGLPRAFLTAPGARWAKSMEMLSDQLYQPDRIAHATLAARDTFALFERAAEEFE